MGITPACAGNSQRRQRRQKDTQDHPRVCGEQAPFLPPARPSRGSPPRVRGTEHENLFVKFVRGITPACAGNRIRHMGLISVFPDHPRVCGEQRA